jgi:hypothetical protein
MHNQHLIQRERDCYLYTHYRDVTRKRLDIQKQSNSLNNKRDPRAKDYDDQRLHPKTATKNSEKNPV